MNSNLSRTRANTYGVKELRKRGSGGETIRTIRVHTAQQVFEAVLVPLLLRTEEFISAWNEWVEYRLECGQVYRWPTRIWCFERSMRKCEQWGAKRAIAAIDHSIEMGYRAVYEPLKFEPHPFHKEQKHVNGTIHTGVQGRIY